MRHRRRALAGLVTAATFKSAARFAAPNAGANIARPVGLAQLNATFGPRCSLAGSTSHSGTTISVPWGNWVNNSSPAWGTLKANSTFMVTYFENAVSEVIAGPGGWSTFNKALYGYNCRQIAGSSKWSTHSWGVAFDVNSLNNPQGSSSWNGTGSNGVNYGGAIPTAFKNQNYYWGINFSGSAADPMHFQYVEGY